jgi:hypothetical protein
MIKIPEQSILQIRTFNEIEEILALEDFEENAPLLPSNYKRLFGDYHVADKVRCCVQKENGKLCDEPHNNGWIIERSDGKLTLVGIDCGVKKFGADRRLRDHISNYQNEKRRLERIASLVDAISSKVEHFKVMAKLRLDIRALEMRISQVTKQLGVQTMRRLKDMIKTRTNDVFITATIRREDKKPDGRIETENTFIQHKLGALFGLELVSRGAYETILEGMNGIVRAYDQGENLMKEPDLHRKSKQINSVVNSMQDFDRICLEGKRLLELESSFWKNDFSLFCFLSSNKQERIEAAKIAIARSQNNSEKTVPENWLSGRETAIKKQLQAHDISI